MILEGLGEHFGSIDETLNTDLDDIMQHYVEQGHIFVVAFLDQVPVGAGALVQEDKYVGRLVRISTHGTYRRRGIGKAMVEHLLDRARQRGYRHVLIETNNGWNDAIRLYKHLGFVEDICNEAGVHMVLELNRPEL